jgi:hypothetical protein
VAGDIVCVLLGCSVPVILRLVEGSHDNEYYFVGEAYMHGIMDGEAMEELTAGDYKLEEFSII